MNKKKHARTKTTTRIQRKKKPSNTRMYADNEGKPKRCAHTHREREREEVLCVDDVTAAAARVRLVCGHSVHSLRESVGSDDRLARFLSYTNIFMTEKRVICVQTIETHWSLCVSSSPKMMMMLLRLLLLFIFLLLPFCCFVFIRFCLFRSLVSNRILVLRLDRLLFLILSLAIASHTYVSTRKKCRRILFFSHRIHTRTFE